MTERAAHQDRSVGLDGTSAAGFPQAKARKSEQSYSGKSTTSPYFPLLVGDARQGGAWPGLGGGVIAAEEGLKEGVDAGVQRTQFLPDFGQVLAQVLVSGVYVLSDGGDCPPEAHANPQDRNDDGDGVGVHEAYPNT